MENENEVWPPPPTAQILQAESQPVKVDAVHQSSFGRIVAGIIGGIIAPTFAFRSGLLYFLIARVEKAIGCEKLAVCGEWYLPLYLVIGILITAVFGSILGGCGMSALQHRSLKSMSLRLMDSGK